MNDNLVNKAFQSLIDAIKCESDVLSECSIRNIRAGDTDQGMVQLRLIESLKELQTKITKISEEWRRFLSTGVKPPVKNGTIRDKRTGLVVTFPSGTIIKEATAAQTFARSIKEFGIDKVDRLQKSANNYPLVSREECLNPMYTQQKIDGVFVMPPSSTRDKKRLLEDIAKELNISIDVSITSSK